MKRAALLQRPFYFLRHGETEANARGVIGGSQDVPLTALGRAQARDSALRLQGHGISHIYSSPLKRAVDTARPIAEILGVRVDVVPGIAERGWGILEGQPRALRTRGVTPAGGETPEIFNERVLNGLESIASEVPLIVSHSGVFRVLCRMLGIAEREAPVANALPVRFVPLAGQDWKLEEIR